ncbi:MAG: hypothetical protein OXI24_08165 [Candidatus Poribacteria bacterium]|nr:hypothetical protein [Candidatus Poribacteria bacterium]
MKLALVFALLLLGAMIGLTGCYTQLGYYASADFDRRYHKVLEKEKMEHDSKTESEESELEKPDDETEDSEGYYGRRKRSYRRTYSHPSRYDTYHWAPYAPYPYYAYSPVWYPFHPWFSGYYRPSYRYYRSYYPSYGYHPYTNVYRRYYGGSRYVPLSRRTYPNRSNWRSENRRVRSSRRVTTPRRESERPQPRTRHRNEN